MSARMRSRSRLAHVVDALAVDEDRAGVRPQQSENQLEDDGFPGAARAEQDLMLPLGTLKLMSRSTTCSSKANDTCSNTTAAWFVLAGTTITRGIGYSAHFCRRTCSGRRTRSPAANCPRREHTTTTIENIQ